MDAILNSSIEFLEKCKRAGSDQSELVRLADARIEQLRVVFAGMPADIAAGTRALDHLANQNVFNDAQKAKLRELVQTGATTDCTGASGHGSKVQTNVYVFKYGTERLWSVLQDTSASDDVACNAWIDVFHMIGLRFAEVDTTKVAVATTFAVRNQPVDAEKAFLMHKRLRALNAKRRESRKDQPLTLIKFPETLQDFLKLYPHIYGTTPPVEAPLTDSE